MAGSTFRPGSIDGATQTETPTRKATKSPPRDDICCIFVHAGAGYHSHQNERIHLEACSDAAQVAMLLLRNGGSALDAVEMAVKILEDREITNAGYGSNLAMDGVVECDASIVDHHGRSGAVGAVAQIKNPISLARLVLNHTMQALTLRRVPPNLLVAQGATEFAAEMGIPILPHDALISPAAKDRWIRWRADLKAAERKARKTSGHPACWKIRNDITIDDENLRQKMREQHERDLLQGYPALTRPMLDTPAEELSRRVERKASSTSATVLAAQSPSSSDSWPSQERESTPESADSEHIQEPPSARPLTVTEASRNALINSTQKVPTVGQYGGFKASNSATSDHIPEDSDMKDAYHSLNRTLMARKSWGDGSGEESDSESSNRTAKPPLSIAIDTPLPQTPVQKQAESPTPRGATPLNLVKETAPLPPISSDPPLSLFDEEDNITDTVGAIAVDSWGRIACAASSGGIGMKYRGRVGPAALVGVGTAVIPTNPDDSDKTCVATVTSGTGEHMATTMAATVCAERIYQGVRKGRGGEYEEVIEDEAIKAMIENEFMGHPSVKNSNSAGAIGILGVKKTRQGIMLYYGHNTDSFAMASMHSDEDRPWCAMSRSNGNGQVAQGGRMMRYKRQKKTKINGLSRQQFA